MRNFFVELTQILEMWKQNGWTTQELEQFLNAYTQCALEIDVLRCVVIKKNYNSNNTFCCCCFRETTLKNAWEKYMKVITQCSLILYP